jgi:hypothetical protein
VRANTVHHNIDTFIILLTELNWCPWYVVFPERPTIIHLFETFSHVRHIFNSAEKDLPLKTF